MSQKVKLTPEIEAFLKSSGTCIDGKYYFIPFWFERVFTGIYKVHSLEHIPDELKHKIEKLRL